jgi:O-antigen/teichoic acid export membrane protein
LITAVSAALGVLLMQVDKFLLSGLLPLADYGHFSMAVVAATSVMVVSAPISTALMPRMVRLHAEGREGELLSIYRLSTRLTSSLGLGGALTLAFCAHPLLTTWTGDAAWAHEFWPVLSLYAMGYGLWAVGAFPYYLQYARGQLQWYLWGNLMLLCIQVPAVVWAAGQSGAVGAGVVWLVVSGFYLVFWGAVVHRRLSPGLHLPWLFRDVLAINWPVLLGMLVIWMLDWSPLSRRETFAYVVLVGGFLMLSNLSWLAWSERQLLQQWRKG